MKNQNDYDTQDIRDMLNTGPVPKIVNQKLGLAYAQLNEKQAYKKPAKKLWRSMLVAATLCCALSVTALAASGQMWPMIQGALGFFENKQQPTTIDSILPSFEAMNAEINASVTDKDITFTVQNVSIDNNFINIFGTVTKQGLREHIKSTIDVSNWANGLMPEKWMLKFCNSVNPVAKIDNKIYGFDNSLNDALNCYFVDDNTVAFAKRILVKDSLPDTFSMDILSSYSLTNFKEEQSLWGVAGEWTVAADIDLTNAKSQEKIVEPQILAIGDKKLDLKKFSTSPLGAVAVTDEHIGNFTFKNKKGEELEATGPTDGFSSIYSYGVRDSKGNWLYPMQLAASGDKDVMTEFTRPANDADSITFVPLTVLNEEEQLKEKITPLAVGSKLEINSISGYTIESFKIDGRHFEVVLVPYGPLCTAGYGEEIDLLAADGTPAYDDAAHLCLQNSTTDHLTGAVTFTQDFYADQPKLASTAQLQYYSFYDMAIDEANSVTVALK